jgi:hypothetical protein
VHTHLQVLAAVLDQDGALRLCSLYCLSVCLAGLNTCSFIPLRGECRGTQVPILQVAVYLLPVHLASFLALLSSPPFPGQASVSLSGFVFFF